jgi:hypothetical protein
MSAARIALLSNGIACLFCMMAQPYYRAMQTAFTAFYEFANEVFAP